jgi:hypothetical protein
MMRSLRGITFLLLLLFLVVGQGAKAQQPAPAENVSVVLVIDSSGSMKTNDPTDLRFTAAKLFISLLDLKDSVSIVNFASRSHVLVDLVRIGAEREKEPLMKKLEGIEAKGNTHMLAAMKDALALLSKDTSPNDKFVVFLTDGEPHPDNWDKMSDNEKRSYVEETLKVAGEIGRPILSIAFTKEAYVPFLEDVSRISKGKLFFAATSRELPEVYEEVFGHLKDRMIFGPGFVKAPTSVKFAIDPFVKKVSFVVVKPESVAVKILTPGERALDLNDPRVTRFLDPRFETVTIEDPAPGTWKVELSGSGEAHVKAIVKSKLRILSPSPLSPHPKGKPMLVAASLNELQPDGSYKRLVGERIFLAELTTPKGERLSLTLYDDGTHGDRTMGDGIFSALYIPELEGPFNILFQTWEGPIPVRSERTIWVLLFPELVVDSPKEKEYELTEPSLILKAHLELEGKPFTLEGARVVAKVRRPDGSMETLTLLKKDGFYEAAFTPTEGKHEVTFTLEGVYKKTPFTDSKGVSFGVKLLVPTIFIHLGEVNLGRVDGLKEGKVITFTVESSSPHEESLTASVPEFENLRVSLEPSRIPPRGKVDVKLTISAVPPFKLSPFKAMDCKGSIVFSSRAGVVISPTSKFPLRFHIPSLWEIYRIWAFLVVLLLLGTVILGRKVAEKMKGPLLTGTLLYWTEATKGSPAMVNLDEFKKKVIIIGQDPGCDIFLPDPSLSPKHAQLRARKEEEQVVVELDPLEDSEIYVGFRRLTTPITLRHEDEFRMGDYTFKYLKEETF